MDYKCKLFALAYIELMDEGKAAEKVGYKAESASKKGKELLKDERVQKELKRLTKKTEKKEIATLEWRMQTLQHIAETHKDASTVNAAISAISELNKMSGDYAPTKSETLNKNANIDLSNVRELLKTSMKEY